MIYIIIILLFILVFFHILANGLWVFIDLPKVRMLKFPVMKESYSLFSLKKLYIDFFDLFNFNLFFQVYKFEKLAEIVGNKDAFFIGAGAGPCHVLNTNAEVFI